MLLYVHALCAKKLASLHDLFSKQWNPFQEVNLTGGQPLWKGHYQCIFKQESVSTPEESPLIRKAIFQGHLRNAQRTWTDFKIGVEIGSFMLTFGLIKDQSDFFSELLTIKNPSVCADSSPIKIGVT